MKVKKIITITIILLLTFILVGCQSIEPKADMENELEPVEENSDLPDEEKTPDYYLVKYDHRIFGASGKLEMLKHNWNIIINGVSKDWGQA